jgi:Fe2+ transport system protein FeoA
VCSSDLNYETRVDHNQIYATLASRYNVNTLPMRIRLEHLGITKAIQVSLLHRSPFLDL